MINQIEARDADNNTPAVLEVQGWIGKDLDKLWIKIDAEYVDSETEETELQLLYSQAIAPFWDLQLGIREISNPSPAETGG